MFRFLTILVILLIENSHERPVKTISISNANNYLSLQLFQHLSNEEKNVFYSPFSISSAFGMLYLGARDKTAEEMKEVLGYNFGHLSNDEINQQFGSFLREISDTDSNKYELNIANKLVAQQNFDILESYKDSLKKFYETTIETADFVHNSIAATNGINDWVKKETHDKIPKLLSQPLDSTTRLVLLNAIYFKGIFTTKFLKNETQEKVFFNHGVNEMKTQMMRRNGKFNYTEVEGLNSKLLELPYSGDDISLYVLLPNQKQGFNQLKSNLKDFTVIENSIRNMREVVVEVNIPKFKIEAEYELNKQLSELGMKQVFTSEADLSGIDGKRDLNVDKVIHKAVIEVNEEGSEAAAATAIVVVVESVSIPHEFNANHPFMFFIRDNRNGMVLFVGQINKL